MAIEGGLLHDFARAAEIVGGGGGNVLAASSTNKSHLIAIFIPFQLHILFV